MTEDRSTSRSESETHAGNQPVHERRAHPGPAAGFRSIQEHRQRVIDRTMQHTVRMIAITLIPVGVLLALGSWFFFGGSRGLALAALCGLTSLIMAGFLVVRRRRPIPKQHVHWVAFALLTPIYVIATLRWALTGEHHQMIPLSMATIATGGLMLSTPWTILSLSVLSLCWLGAAWTQPFNADLLLVGVFQIVAVLVAAALHLLRRSAHHRIAELMAEGEDQRFLLVQQARTDELTGVLNRRAVMATLERRVERCEQYGAELGVIMIDLDDFKKINDMHGHAAGDDALREFSYRVGRALRSTDILGRYGGEEFVCILPESNADSALRIAERIRKGIASEPFYLKGTEVPVTASLGLTVSIPGVRFKPDRLLQAADRALLQAKADGKNRVVMAENSGVLPVLV